MTSWQTEIFWRVAWLISKINGKEPLLSKYSARSAHSISTYSSKKIQHMNNFEFEKIEKTIQEITTKYPRK